MKYKSSSLVEVPFLVIFTDRLLFCFSFDGRVLAKLPFVPISWFQNLSHRNLPGSDYTHCSYIYIHIMSITQVSNTTLYYKDSTILFLQYLVTDELQYFLFSLDRIFRSFLVLLHQWQQTNWHLVSSSQHLQESKLITVVFYMTESEYRE